MKNVNAMNYIDSCIRKLTGRITSLGIIVKGTKYPCTYLKKVKENDIDIKVSK